MFRLCFFHMLLHQTSALSDVSLTETQATDGLQQVQLLCMYMSCESSSQELPSLMKRSSGCAYK